MPVRPRVAGEGGSRAVGVGCPHCSIIGVSEREIRLKFELAAAGLPVVPDHPPIAVDGRRPVKADIVIPDLRVVVEYDGSYYHKALRSRDRNQTAALESAGWTVLRVREDPLPSLGGHEVFVLPTAPIKILAVLVLDGLDRPGHTARHLEDVRAYARRPRDEPEPSVWSKGVTHRHLWAPTRRCRSNFLGCVAIRSLSDEETGHEQCQEDQGSPEKAWRLGSRNREGSALHTFPLPCPSAVWP